MNITAIVVFSIIALIFAIDIVLIFKKGKIYSISAWIIRHSKKHPVFPFMLGFIFGHLFWRMDTLDIYNCDSEQVEAIINQCMVEDN